METARVWPLYAESVRTGLHLFRKSGRAFLLGYAVSAMIQAFVPRAGLTGKTQDPWQRNIALATILGGP